MYAGLFLTLADDYAQGGKTRALLEGRSAHPVHDAVPLRLAGAVHRVVLRGDEPGLARHYPSTGGSPGPGFHADFVACMEGHLGEIESGLASQVQTNEVGRSVVPLAVAHWVTTLGVQQFRYLEIGASAGLNLNFDRYAAVVHPLRMGDPSSPVQFGADWFDGVPNVPLEPARVTERRGVDIEPVDLTDPEQELRLLSFVWPDQLERFARLRSAMAVAADHPPKVDRESADTWLDMQLGGVRDLPTVVFHSIVWQYLGEEVRAGIRRALAESGIRATPRTPLLWVRMEPAGPVADVRVTVWDGGEPWESVLAEVGYHGQNMRWLTG